MYIEYFQIVLFFQLNMYWRKKIHFGIVWACSVWTFIYFIWACLFF